MKINFNQPVRDYRGQALISGGKVEMLNDHVGQTMYMAHMVSGHELTPDEKYMAYKICSKMQSAEPVDISMEEGAFILKVCGVALVAGAYGQLKDLIEG